MSGHFRREARIMAGLIIGIIGIGLLVAFLAPHIRQWLVVDRYLDAGGSYNYHGPCAKGRDRVASLRSPRAAVLPNRPLERAGMIAASGSGSAGCSMPLRQADLRTGRVG
jgi:hypothetical protein